MFLKGNDEELYDLKAFVFFFGSKVATQDLMVDASPSHDSQITSFQRVKAFGKKVFKIENE